MVRSAAMRGTNRVRSCFFTLSALALASLVVAPSNSAAQPASASCPSPAYALDAPGVVVSPEAQGVLAAVASAFCKSTGKTLSITSGFRTPANQAKQLVRLLLAGTKLPSRYENKEAAAELQSEFQTGVAAGEAPALLEERLTTIIERQIRRGSYISKHLVGGAVDVRTRTLTEPEVAELRSVAGKHRVYIPDEPGGEPHLHFNLVANATAATKPPDVKPPIVAVKPPVLNVKPPIVDDGKRVAAVECKSNAECGEPWQCVAGKCVRCTQDADCNGMASTRRCVNQSCVMCRTNADCSTLFTCATDGMCKLR